MDRKNTIEAVSSMREDIYIYGTGLSAKMGCEALDRLSVNCKGFIDVDKEKWGSVFCGREIKGLNQILPDEQILIMANPEYKIHERLQQAGYFKWLYVDSEILKKYENGYFEKIQDKLRENSQKIKNVYNMLADEQSRTIFEYILMHRMHHRLDLIEKIYDKNQYFGNDLIIKAEGSIVDCGAYTGDTLRRFLKQSNIEKSDYQYYAFEAEKKNYDILINYCKDISNVQAYNIAVWDKREEVSFASDSNIVGGSGRVTEEGGNNNKLLADSLDNILGNAKIDMITMDIEGAEIKALIGAEKIIKKWHPSLAISAYHKLEHLWEIPILMKEIDKDYQIYYRHHCWNMDDTVCYGI